MHFSTLIDGAAESSTTFSSAVIQPSTSMRPITQRRRTHAVGPGILHGCMMDHSRTLGHVARPLPDIAAQLAPTLADRQIHSEAGLRLAGKASESLLGAWYPLSTSPKDCGAKSSTGSDEVASWFSAYRASLSAKQGIAACSPEVRQNEENV